MIPLSGKFVVLGNYKGDNCNVAQCYLNIIREVTAMLLKVQHNKYYNLYGLHSTMY